VVLKLLQPQAASVDVGQTDGCGLGRVRHSFFMLLEHFNSFAYSAAADPAQLEQHVLQALASRKAYYLRPVPMLSFLLDPRYVGRTMQMSPTELACAMVLLKFMVASHDVKSALSNEIYENESYLPANFWKDISHNIMTKYTSFRARKRGALKLPISWAEATAADPNSWRRTWGDSVPHLQYVSVKIMRLPTKFGAGERSFSNAASIQTKMRSRMSYATFHKLL